MKVIFLGTGGGRWVTLTQRLRTGGFRIHGTANIHVDPGPGALLGLRDFGVPFSKTDALVVTHCHPDHYTDSEVLIEAMTNGATLTRGTLLASESVVRGWEDLGPAISRHHLSRVENLVVMAGGRQAQFHGTRMEGLPAHHRDPTTFGFRLQMDGSTISYTSDTSYKKGLAEGYKDSRVLILNVIRPGRDRIPFHLCTEDAVKIISEVEPELAVINHFGMKMVDVAGKEAARVRRETGVKTVAATDGMEIDIRKDINIGKRLTHGQTRLV
ncbi:MAG: MBL fold metallo-hydrolase [Euryarchaeota archaeon]|nr:MBL fold metallo-hydrolase [Euryarchaeota archaeon]